ncbi:glycosyltransferase [Isoptericola variabilis]|uniref:glycosyltransferase n=1 Tax=Isoptericola variabilis TaxID=139208 RepID=UPI00117E6D9F|nr:nucleotide disphospho-sugar-binding domain-containing protein [Isoptericola variabilis]
MHVTQGTYRVDPRELVVPALEALGPVPANARVAEMVPYERLLPLTSVMVTNRGWGGVLAALRHGVPLVVAPTDMDKPEIAARVAGAGVGVDLRTGTPSAARRPRRISSRSCWADRVRLVCAGAARRSRSPTRAGPPRACAGPRAARAGP